MPRATVDINDSFEQFFALLEAYDTTGPTGINGSIGPNGIDNGLNYCHTSSTGIGWTEFSGSSSCTTSNGSFVVYDMDGNVIDTIMRKRSIFKPLSEVKKFGIVDFCNKYYK